MIDATTQLTTVRRTVGERAIDAGQARTTTVSQRYDTTTDDLWDACTNGERIPRWFLPITGKLELGGTYQLEGNAGGTILECEPGRSFVASWEFNGGVSWIEVTVEPDGDGARFTLTHIAQVDDEIWDQFGPAAVGMGWDLALVGLATHLATGAAVDPADGQAWAMSPEGLEFQRASGAAWGDAEVAAGVPAEVARPRADRCIAAYTELPEDDATS